MPITVFIIVFLLFLLMGMPISFVMLISSVAYFIASNNLDFFMIIPERIFSALNIFVLMALPFFMLSGEIMNRIGMSERLIEFSNIIIGRVRGGLAQVNVLASILFAGITGIALGDIAALGKIFIPAMEKQGYSKSFAGAVTAASSIVGPIIPPSTIIILYCAVMEISVGGMFVSAIIPGILIGVSDMIIVAYLARKRNYPIYKTPISYKILCKSTKNAILALLMPVLIVGGILGGIFTPTEAAATAAIYSIFIGFFVYRNLKFSYLKEILKNSVYDSARLFFILASAAVVSWIFAMENISEIVSALFLGISNNKYLLILLINIIYLFLGLWLSPGAIIILFAPVFAPLAYDLGLHPFQYGIMVIINCNIGILTPPVGFVLFAVASIAKIDIIKLTKDLLPFLAINMVVIFLVAFIPELSLWIPHMAGLVK